MTEQSIERLVKHYKLSDRVARALVVQGLLTPALIRAATDEELLALRGLTEDDLVDIRAKVG